MFSSAAGFAEKLWPGGGVCQFSFCIGRIQILNWRRRRRPRIWLDNEHGATTGEAVRCELVQQHFASQDVL
jgi:hypothetical protein